MMKNALILTVSVLLMMSCSTSGNDNGTTGKETVPRGDLVYIHIYRSDSIKAQPELMLIENDQVLLNSMKEWIKTGIPTELPEFDSIDKIYVFQFDHPSSTHTFMPNITTMST